MVTEVTRYVANDGKEFTTRGEAAAHEARRAAVESLISYLSRDTLSYDAASAAAEALVRELSWTKGVMDIATHRILDATPT